VHVTMGNIKNIMVKESVDFGFNKILSQKYLKLLKVLCFFTVTYSPNQFFLRYLTQEISFFPVRRRFSEFFLVAY